MKTLVYRRQFLSSASISLGAVVSAIAGTGQIAPLAQAQLVESDTFEENGLVSGVTFSQDRNGIRFFVPGLKMASRILHVTDTHLFLDDERGKPFQEYSARMAGAYHQQPHCVTGEPTTPMESFEEALRFAREKKVDAVALTGDILSFPSEAGADWALERLQALENDGISFYYCAGNHDWHYEGWPGTDEEQRAEWIPKRLNRFYAKGVNPLCFSVTKKGIRHLFIDDSINIILPEQLEFLRSELSLNEPTVVWMHIPPYAPGRSVGFACGHPDWGAKTDSVWQIERRERWPEGGHSKVTFAFHRELCQAPNLLGTVSGHVHANTLDIVCGKPFVTTEANALGGMRLIEFLPNDFKITTSLLGKGRHENQI